MTEAATVAADLLPAQEELFNSTEREVLLSGGWGSAKSRGLCYALLKHALIRNNTVVLARKTLTDLKVTTLRTLLEADGTLPPVLPYDTYEHNKADGVIRIVGGGTIYYFGFGTGETEISARKARSLNLGAVALDQAEEFTENEYITLSRRLRNPVDPCPQILAACNPAGPSHFLYRWFHLGDPENRPSDRRVIYAKTLDNYFLPSAYVKSLQALPGVYHERYVQGRWVGFEGSIYPMWSPQLHVASYSLGGGLPEAVYAGVDVGFTNPFCIEVAVERKGMLHVIAEGYRPGMVEPDQVALCLDFAERYGVTTFFIDPSAPQLAVALRREGLHVRAANNDVVSGIIKIQRRLQGGRLLISPECKMLVDQIAGYTWKRGKDEPVKDDDHAPDALRYIVSTLDPLIPMTTSDEHRPISMRKAEALARAEAAKERETAKAPEQERLDAALAKQEAIGVEVKRSESWLTVDNDEIWETR